MKFPYRSWIDLVYISVYTRLFGIFNRHVEPNIATIFKILAIKNSSHLACWPNSCLHSEKAFLLFQYHLSTIKLHDKQDSHSTNHLPSIIKSHRFAILAAQSIPAIFKCTDSRMFMPSTYYNQWWQEMEAYDWNTKRAFPKIPRSQ